MNKQFENLMYRAGLTANGCWDQMDSYNREAINKFAELIVREGASYFNATFEKSKDHPVRQYTDATPEENLALINHNQGWLLAYEFAGDALLDHFGVDE